MSGIFNDLIFKKLANFEKSQEEENPDYFSFYMMVSIINNLNERSLLSIDEMKERTDAYRRMISREIEIVEKMQNIRFGEKGESDSKRVIWLREVKKKIIMDKEYRTNKFKLDQYVYSDYNGIIVPFIKSLTLKELGETQKVAIGGWDIVAYKRSNY